MIDLNNLPFTFDKMIEAIESKENFSLSRWGDGEWMCLLGYKGRNTDKHNYYPDTQTPGTAPSGGGRWDDRQREGLLCDEVL